jgi:hypothetical protein
MYAVLIDWRLRMHWWRCSLFVLVFIIGSLEWEIHLPKMHMTWKIHCRPDANAGTEY